MGDFIQSIRREVTSFAKDIKEACPKYMGKRFSTYSNTSDSSRSVFRYLQSVGRDVVKRRQTDFDAVDLTEEYNPVCRFEDDFVLGDPPLLDAPRPLDKLCYLIDLQLLRAEEKSYGFAREEATDIDRRNKTFNEKKIEAMHEAIRKEKQYKRWGTLQAVIGWVAPMSGIVVGGALIFSGSGAVAGSMILASSVIALTMSVTETFGLWQKLTNLLPGDDPDKKRAVMMWTQLGVAVFCAGVSGVGMMCGGGFSAIKESMGAVMQVFSGLATAAGGVGVIGRGITGYQFKNRLADSKHFEAQIKVLQHEREDLSDLLENGVERIEEFYKMLSSTLKLQRKVFSFSIGN